MKNPKQGKTKNLKYDKTSFYLDREVLDLAIKKLGPGANISNVIRQCLQDIVDTEMVRIKISKEVKKKYDIIMMYPGAEEAISMAFENALEEAKKKIQKDMDKIK